MPGLRCTRCNNAKTDDGRKMCERCRQTMRKQYYKYRRKDEMARYAQMAELKESTPCTDCGKSLSHKHMHWDHLPGFEKIESISEMLRHPARYTREDIDAELTKCELVCDRCHHRRGRERGQHKPMPRTGQEIPCEVCGDPVYRTPSLIHDHVYCSKTCMGLGQRTKLKIHQYKPPKTKPKYKEWTVRRARMLSIPLPDGSDPNDPKNPRV